jgi:hypothetical protein
MRKSEPFICLALKPSPQKHRLEKIKCTFDLALCNELFDILLNFIKLFDHKVIPSPLELKEKKYCKCHNSFDRTILAIVTCFAKLYNQPLILDD